MFEGAEWLEEGLNEEWLLRPVLAGLCRYEAIKDGSLDLSDFLIMNEALDVQAENQERLRRSLTR